MVLGAASHGPAHRRSRQVGRLLLTEARTQFGSHVDDRAALFKYALPPMPMGEATRKDDLNKMFLIQPCQYSADDWTSTIVVETHHSPFTKETHS